MFKTLLKRKTDKEAITLLSFRTYFKTRGLLEKELRKTEI